MGMKTNLLLIVAAFLGGCVTNSKQPRRELSIMVQRENAYRDNGYTVDEARLAALQDDWRSHKEVKAFVIQGDWNREPLPAVKVEPPAQSPDFRLVAGN